MFIDMLGQPDLHKYDLSSAEAGEKITKNQHMSLGRCLMRLFTQCCLNSHCSLIKGIVAGSSCPPEIARKLVTDMDVKEMMVN